MTRIIPGVQVSVIKEVVPPQLAPSGVLGLVGLVAPTRIDAKGKAVPRRSVERVGSWGRFRELYGRATAWAMPEAQQALQNGVYELVVVEVSSTVAVRPKATFQLGSKAWLTFEFRTAGTLGNGLKLVWTAQPFQGNVQGYELKILKGEEVVETHRNLSPLVGSERWIGKILAGSDSLVDLVTPKYVLANFSAGVTLTDKDIPIVTVDGQAVLSIKKLVDENPVKIVSTTAALKVTRSASGAVTELFSADPQDPELHAKLFAALSKEEDLQLSFVNQRFPDQELSGGVDATVDEYTDALGALVDVSDVDLVIASIQDLTTSRASAIYGAVIAHCQNMSAEAQGRLGFGQVPKDNEDSDNFDLVRSLVSDRFALFAPYGVLGAAVGRIGSLDYYRSPTFKTLAGLGQLSPALRVEQQRMYLTERIVPVAELLGRGIVVVRGITTDGDQINVRRVADRAVRGVKQIGELFIGKLNTENGRNALKQKLNEFFMQMTAESAIVPSTDGTDPAFKLDVYSTQADFALGIVRVDLAVRPVRAIDYIYATVLVQV